LHLHLASLLAEKLLSETTIDFIVSRTIDVHVVIIGEQVASSVAIYTSQWELFLPIAVLTETLKKLTDRNYFTLNAFCYF
jgi:hypothetical protein